MSGGGLRMFINVLCVCYSIVVFGMVLMSKQTE